ncbi:hypothetical protein EDB81DRAFT_884882 [Dactylonectria macrodidyma]|uniref:FAD-dependent oxidoreductase 2 FAD-binding domain-containing protein n=1 Tax=Dactylonectria macrodidyma TaxID=307937 RepID=A0A9P9ELR4_9HYPO|nr:hypothetical protein EDB81DRAFT_884882 [Dactylonectria macrodidyma]
MDRMTAWRFLYPPVALLEGIVVDVGGQRRGSEDLYGVRLTEAMITKASANGHLILDSTQWAKAKKQLPQQTSPLVGLQRAGWLYWDYTKAPSLGRLAVKLGVDSAGLGKTVEPYNDDIVSNKPDEMRKTTELCTPILKAPFYALDISAQDPLGIQAVLGLTLGGLRVDEDYSLLLIDQDKKISGLYAAGRTAAGVCSNGYISGLSLTDGMFSRRRAAEHALSVA